MIRSLCYGFAWIVKRILWTLSLIFWTLLIFVAKVTWKIFPNFDRISQVRR